MADKCSGCGSTERTKAGFVGKVQRWLCKSCGRHYMVSERKDAYPQEKRRMALEMYLEGLGYRAIGRILQISHVTVYGWIKAFGRKAEALKSEEAIEVVEVDELHSYVGEKKATSGYGLLLIDIRSGSSLLSVDAEGRPPVPNS